MTPIRLIVLLVALLAGGAAAYLALNLEPEGQPSPTEVKLNPQLATRDILVAAADIPPGASLTAANVRWQPWPEDNVNPAYIEKTARSEALEKLEGTIVRTQFLAGEPIREGKLARAESGFLSAILPSGKRAIAVRVSAQSAAGGFVLPNDHVDIILTTAEQGVNGEAGQQVSRTLLSNVRVLAVDQEVEEREGQPVVIGKTATLEVSPREAEIVTAAESSGTLALALRSMADADNDQMVEDRDRSGVVKIIRFGREQMVKTR
ncbi:Flp pilus assembly protein CpaB [Afifella sp. IM 167]|uniref:Flp pilus assembly protein CpaB n=1 Tax=Afifella sp. IM 167 TaxID=2033586 RepID=UPI001CC9D116|nr:Flp pilus assembly protein CpaB [Afifella sp. IM 167]MBZ8133776.1 Flp pilus assembly protein CpaB [Afifella sp. IM 167]